MCVAGIIGLRLCACMARVRVHSCVYACIVALVYASKRVCTNSSTCACMAARARASQPECVHGGVCAWVAT